MAQEKSYNKVYGDFTTGLSQGGKSVAISQVPYGAWAPISLYWGVLALVFGICLMAMIWMLHRQWAHHEQLSYPHCIGRHRADRTHRRTPDFGPLLFPAVLGRLRADLLHPSDQLFRGLVPRLRPQDPARHVDLGRPQGLPGAPACPQ